MIPRILIVVSIVLFGVVGDSPGKRAPCLRHFESPIYDVVARHARLQGDVHLHVVVNKDGNVESVEFIPTAVDPLLRTKAIENVTRWTFEPGDKFEFTIVYEFRLSEPELDYPPATITTLDFPEKVRVETRYATIMRD